MKISIDPWDPSYGTSGDGGGPDEPAVTTDLSVECDPAAWAPIDPAPGAAVPPDQSVVFVDGVRRVDARVWITPDDPLAPDTPPVPGECAAWAAGAVRCAGGAARVVVAEVDRGLVAPWHALGPLATKAGVYRAVVANGPRPEDLWLAVQAQMAILERRVADTAVDQGPAALVVLDGPLRGSEHLPCAIGMVKTHHIRYLQGEAAAVLEALRPGQRTPAFCIAGGFARHSWYVRLPGGDGGGPFAGVVRCEATAALDRAGLVRLADLTAAILPRYASAAHRDRRAPQNLTPIAGLERRLRHLLGDPAYLYKALRLAAARPAA